MRQQMWRPPKAAAAARVLNPTKLHSTCCQRNCRGSGPNFFDRQRLLLLKPWGVDTLPELLLMHEGFAILWIGSCWGSDGRETPQRSWNIALSEPFKAWNPKLLIYIYGIFTNCNIHAHNKKMRFMSVANLSLESSNTNRATTIQTTRKCTKA